MRLSDNCLYIVIIFYLLISIGCSKSAVPENIILSIPMRLQGTYSETHTAFYEHIDKYLQCKETYPVLALDTAGVAILPQTLAGNKLVLEMVVDNDFTNGVILLQRRSIERDEQRIETLKADGKEPEKQIFRFIFMPTEYAYRMSFSRNSVSSASFPQSNAM